MRLIFGLIYAVLFLTLWHIVAVSELVPGYILPSPGLVGASLLAVPSLYAFHTCVTAFEAVSGLAIGGLSAAGLALLIFECRMARLAFLPGILFLQVFPKEALAPLF